MWVHSAWQRMNDAFDYHGCLAGKKPGYLFEWNSSGRRWLRGGAGMRVKHAQSRKDREPDGAHGREHTPVPALRESV